jgi:hypothetical protein
MLTAMNGPFDIIALISFSDNLVAEEFTFIKGTHSNEENIFFSCDAGGFLSGTDIHSPNCRKKVANPNGNNSRSSRIQRLWHAGNK